MSNEFISLVNSVFTDKSRSILDLTQGATFETILTDSFNEYFVANLLKKASGLDLGIDPDAVAIEDFKLFLKDQDDKVIKVGAILNNIEEYPVLNRVLENVKHLMAQFFAPWAVVSMKPRFTSGATLSLKKGDSVFARVKASEGQQILRKHFQLLYNDNGEYSGNYADPLLDVIPHTVGTLDWYVRIITVSKQWDVSRIVGLGPSSALAHQCGFADWLSNRLKVFCGIDLSTAPSLHKELAQANSLDGPFSTQDQRKASDNILRILVEHVVPGGVYDYMNAITPTILEIDGLKYSTHMLCPAGNGFNTPFQTLLFWTLIKGIQMEMGIKQKVYVYGDDVIVHNSAYDAVSKVFPLLGLEINLTKSFKEGPFRESCGGDYLYGINIRSFYAKNIPQSTIDWIKFCNGVRRVGFYNNHGYWRTNELRLLWFRSILHIPKDERLYCPRHYGDAGINTECESLYDLQPVPTWDRERAHKYPNNGYDHGGNPYGSERIKIYVSRIGGDRTTFPEESKNLSGSLVLRTLSSPFLVGAGLKLRKSNVGKSNKSPVFYPAVFSGCFEKYVTQNVPYTLFGQAPEDIDELFTHISGGAGARISNKETTLRRLYVKDLISILKTRIESLETRERVSKLSLEAHKEASELTLGF